MGSVLILVLVFLVCFIVYQLTPTLHIYTREWWSYVTTTAKVHRFMHDTEYELPPELQPKMTVRQFYSAREAFSTEWGSPSMDGPSRLAPGKCWWVQGCVSCLPELSIDKKSEKK